MPVGCEKGQGLDVRVATVGCQLPERLFTMPCSGQGVRACEGGASAGNRYHRSHLGGKAVVD